MALAEAPLNHDLNQESDDNGSEVIDDSALSAGLAPSLGDAIGGPVNDQISTYVVHEGDTLSQIAKMFGVSANTILWANDIPRGGALKAGQQLVILPVSGIQYVVKKGDTVAALAKKYSADAEEIRSFNGIEGGLTVGDEIVIPNGVEPAVPVVGAVKKFIANITSSYVQTDGYFIRPAKGTKTQGIHGKNGVDFSYRGGLDVVAAAGGEVVVSVSSGYNGGYGHYIVIKHSNGTQTLYGHLSENLVAAGTVVSQGQLIGKIGNTGRSSGPHLHFEVRGGANPF